MKIEKLTILNLNSLSGRNEINFNTEPFNGCGLFAITGPTGAGKSTIFDAICLSLYGRTPRLKNPDEIMSRHEAECFSELTFSVNGKRFRSRWEQRRSRGQTEGKLQASKMSLCDLNDKIERIIEDKKSNVPLSVSEITGLDYDQFTRSILLAQGNFASFLSANINERAELLEKMTGSEIYSKLSIEAFNRSKKEDDKLTGLKEKLGDTELLDSNVRIQYEHDQKHYETEKEKIRKEITLFSESQKWIEQEVILKNRIDSARYELSLSERQELEIIPQKKDLERKEKIAAAFPLYESLKFVKDDLSKKEKDLVECENSIKVQVKKSEEFNQVLQKKSEILNENITKITFLQNLIEKLQVLKSSLDSEQIALETKHVKRGEINNNLHNSISHLNKIEKDKKSLTIISKALDDYIHTHSSYSEINKILPFIKDKFVSYHQLRKNQDFGEDVQGDLTNSDLGKIRTNLIEMDKKIYLIENEKPGDRGQYEKIKEILLKLSPLSKYFTENREDRNNYLNDKKNYQKKLTLNIKNLADSRCDFDNILAQEEKKSIADHAHIVRKTLTDGDVCPVCHGIYHNRSNSIQEESGVSNPALAKNLSAVIHKLETDIEVLQEKIFDLDKRIENCSEKEESIMTEWVQIRASFFPDLLPTDRDLANKIYSENENNILNFNNWENELNLTISEERKLKESYEKLNKINEYIKIKKELSGLLAQFNLSMDYSDPITQLESFEKAFLLKQDEKISAERNIENISNIIQNSKNEIIKTKEQLASMDFDIKNNQDKIQLTEKEISLISDDRSVDDLRGEIISLRSKGEQDLENAKKDLSRCREVLSQLQGKLGALKEELPTLREQYEKLIAQFNKILKTGHLEYSDFRNEHIIEEVDKQKKLFESIRDKKIRSEESLSNALKTLNDHQLEKPEERYLIDVSEKLKKIKNEIEELSRQSGILEEKLLNDDVKRRKSKELAAAYAVQESECLNWSRIKNLIGSADGKIYRRFVQGLTLEKLVQLANKHLSRLNNRYRIERSIVKELEIEIVDGWQADTIRPSMTLSGGESFLVSLALSLGLSELVGNKVVIDSLFLDEGFGTLDPEALEIVLSALETLQSSGKLIGIISHVAAIRERISVQIRVKKMAGGRSSIDIV